MLTKNDKLISIPKTLWNQAKIQNEDYVQVDNTGEKKFSKFKDIGPEVYDELYSSFPTKIEETPNNSWARNLLKQIKEADKNKEGDLNDLDMLRKRTVGNELWSSIGTESFLQSFVSSAVHEGTVEDTQADEDVKAYLERLKEDLQNQPKQSKEDKKTIKELEKQIEDKTKIIEDKQQKQDDYMNNVNNNQIRQAIRKAAKQANEEINEVTKAINAFSFGDDPHNNTIQKSIMGKKLAPFVKSSNKIKQIMELLGRMKRTADNEINNKPRQGTDEIVGIELGNNLERLLPSQLMYLADDLLEDVFLKRFSNRELLQYELSDEPPKDHGPLIVLVDSSGSMDGDRIQWAMAVTLTFLHIATKQHRDMQVIHFGSDVVRVDTFDKDKSIDLDKVMETISFFDSSGGTNFTKPIEKACDTLATSDNYKDADIIMLTDGQSTIKDNIKEQIKTGKDESGLKFFSIIIGSDNDSKDLTEVSNEVINLKDALKDSDKINSLFSAV